MRSAGTAPGDAKAAARRERSGRGEDGSRRVASERPPPFADELHACIYCNYCSAECPTARQVGWESVSPRGKIRLFRSIVEGWDPRRGVEVPDAFVRGVYECTSCGRCSAVCHVGIDYLSHNEEWRRWLARSGCGPMEDHEVLVRSLANYRNPYMSPRRDRARWAEGLDLPARGEMLFFAGCSDSFVHPNVARRAVTVLSALGHDVAYMGAGEPCCGSTAARLGLEDDFAGLATEVASGVGATGASTMVTACPGCSSAFRDYYPDAGVDLGVEVLHLTELLDRELAAGNLRVRHKLPGRYAWYDPCHLGRVDGVLEPPRRVLAACVEEAVELARNRAEGLCCGSGGGLKTAFPDQATGIGGRVVEMALDAGVTALVTACPWCETNIGDASAAEGAGIAALDLVDVVWRAMGLEGEDGGTGSLRRAPGRLTL